MKKIRFTCRMAGTVCALLLALCNKLNAQSYLMTPHYPVVHQSGATLAQIIDTMQAHTNLADTGEGGAVDRKVAG